MAEIKEAASAVRRLETARQAARVELWRTVWETETVVGRTVLSETVRGMKECNSQHWATCLLGGRKKGASGLVHAGGKRCQEI